MRDRHPLPGGATALLATLAVLLTAAAAPAQPAPVRGDAAGVLGWLAERPDLEDDWDDWANVFLAGVGGGVYWTEHLRTAFDLTWSDEAGVTASRAVPVPGLSWQPSAYTEWQIGHTQLALGQQYQFLSNTWVHPYVGGGLLLDWERRQSETPRQEIGFDWRPGGVPGRSVVIAEASRTGPDTRVVARPFVEGGAKFYLSERAFFRAEVRWAGNGTRQIATRFGVGVDW